MSFLFKGDYGIGTDELTDVSADGYRDAAKHLISQYERGCISKDEKSGDIGRVLEYEKVDDLEKLRIKYRGW